MICSVLDVHICLNRKSEIIENRKKNRLDHTKNSHSAVLNIVILDRILKLKLVDQYSFEKLLIGLSAVYVISIFYCNDTGCLCFKHATLKCRFLNTWVSILLEWRLSIPPYNSYLTSISYSRSPLARMFLDESHYLRFLCRGAATAHDRRCVTSEI